MPLNYNYTGSATLDTASLFAKLADTTVPTIPPITTVPPNINIPTAPVITLPEAPNQVLQYTAPAIPSEPTIEMPIEPILREIEDLTIPYTSFPEYDEACPELKLLAPSTNYAYGETQYDFSYYQELRLKLLDNLRNGGYGIDKRDEAVIAAQSRDRVTQNNKKSIASLLTMSSLVGFELPQGLMLENMRGITAEAIRAQNEAEGKIYVERASLYNQNWQFVIQQLHDTEKTMVQYYLQNEERRLNAYKAIGEIEIASYNKSVEYHRFILERYKTYSDVVRDKIQGVAVALQQYELQIKSRQLTIEENRAELEQYQSKLIALRTTVELYKTRMEGANIHASIENMRMEAYKTSVDAYVATVKAKETEMSLYESTIRGEVVKTEVYKAQLQADVTKIQAATAQLDAVVKQRELIYKQIEAQIDEYKAKLQRDEQVNKIALEALRVSAANDKIYSDINLAAIQGQAIHKELQLKTDVTASEIKYNSVRTQAVGATILKDVTSIMATL